MTTITDTAPAAPLAVPYSSIPKKAVHWFWKGFIPFRHVTLVIGPAGTSKGITTIDLGARMTRHELAPGEREFDELYDGPRDIVLIAPEDDPNETVAWRLDAAGAIPDRVHNLTVLPDGQRFSVPTDIPAITQVIREIEFDADEDGNRTIQRYAADGKPRKVGMVIMDPLLSLAEDELTRRKPARAVIEALEDAAKANSIVILLTHHTNADGRAAGSRGLVETARNQLSLSRLPGAKDDSPVRLCTVTKTNIGITGAVQRYALTGSIEEPHIVWTCEAPPEDASRGYDVTAAVPADGPLAGSVPAAERSPKQAGCRHPWKAGSCSDCPLRRSGGAVGKHAQAAKPVLRPARPPYVGIPLSERYRASYLVGNGKPQVIDDYATPEQARHACQQKAPVLLNWQPIKDQPGLQGAAYTDRVTGETTYCAVLDRYAKAAAAGHDKKAA